jgi:hypothetical protein
MISHRQNRGTLLAEYPAALWLFFIGLAIPLMCIACVLYRSLFFYFAVRDSCYMGAKAPTFSLAQSTAWTTFAKEVAAWNGITYSANPQILVEIKPLAGGLPQIVSGPILQSQLNTTTNLYFIREIATGSINPIFMGGSYLGMNIPGLSSPYPLTMTVDVYVENPTGLVN